MKKTLQRSALGLVILLVVIVAAMTFVLDTVVERVIETKGSEIVGARVDLSGVDISFFPLGAELRGLQVTDPDRPMRNALEARSITAQVDARPLLSRKVIVDDVTVTGVRFDTPRAASGALPGVATVRATEKPDDIPAGRKTGISGFQIPDVGSILQSENLKSIELAGNLKVELNQRIKAWEDRLTQLPTEQNLKEYEKRINELGKSKGNLTGVLGAAAEFQSLRSEITSSLDLLKTASRELQTERNRFNDRLTEISKAPAGDFRILKEKYGISVTGLGNLTKLFLEDKFRGYVDTGVRWYGRLQPYLSGADTVAKPEPVQRPSVTKADEDGLPGFLIRVANVSAELPWGQITGKVENITDNQKVLGLPTLFSVGGSELKGLERLTLQGTYDELKQASASVAFKMVADGLRISDFAISKSKDLPVLLAEGLGHLNINGSISGQQIDSNVLFNVSQALFRSDTVGGDDTTRIIASALEQISQLGLSADIAGTLSDYAINLRSNLDTALRSAFEAEAKRLAAKFEKDLRAGIQEQTAPYLDEVRAAVSGFQGVDQYLQERTDLASRLLGTIPKGATGGLKLPF